MHVTGLLLASEEARELGRPLGAARVPGSCPGLVCSLCDPSLQAVPRGAFLTRESQSSPGLAPRSQTSQLRGSD